MSFDAKKKRRERLSDGTGKTYHMGPAKCSCGEELVIACPRGCEHAELHLHGEVDPISELHGPRGPEKPQSRHAKPKRPKLPNICGRCGTEIPRTTKGGAPPKYHDACRTPAELHVLANNRAWHAAWLARHQGTQNA